MTALGGKAVASSRDEEKEAAVVRAQKVPVSEDDLEFFRRKDPNKDPELFWQLLRDWYQDDSDGSWHAEWAHFFFPSSPAIFGANTSEAGLSPGRFNGEANFFGTTFAGVNFSWITFTGDAIFSNATFDGDALFHGASFNRVADFSETTFRSDANFSSTTFFGWTQFSKATFEREASFSSAKLKDNGRLLIVEAGNSPGPNGPMGPAEIRFYGTSMAAVELERLDGGEIRFREAIDIEKLSISDVKWPIQGSGHRVADEDDLEVSLKSADKRADTAGDGPTWQQVERIYRSLRKNHEDRNDRVGAHKWYYAEMEIGRRYPTREQRRAGAAEQKRTQMAQERPGFVSRTSGRLAERYPMRHFARNFYKWTSNYGLSAIRPAVWLLSIALVAFGLFMTPSPEVCPALEKMRAGVQVCAGAEDVAKTVLLAIFFQPVPDGLVFVGFTGQAVWLLIRLIGAAMLLSIGVAFRNQVAR
jgi:hypothetical protein